MRCEFGDVVLVPFPFSDQSGLKKRPALIASSNDYNREHPDVVILAVTSRSPAAVGRGEFVIHDTSEAGLLKVSYGKPVLATIDQRLLLKKLGHLAEADILALRASLRYIIDGW